MLSQRRAEKVLGVDLVVWVDPRRITRSVPRLETHLRRDLGRRFPAMSSGLGVILSSLRPVLPFVLRPSLFPSPKPLSENHALELMTDLVQRRSEPERSLWWQEHAKAIAQTGSTVVKGRKFAHEDQLREHLTGYLMPIVDSLSLHGWDRALGSAEAGAASIGQRGELFKAESVNHRFFIARALGTAPFPLRVRTVHAEWWSQAVKTASRRDWAEAARAALRTVELHHR